MTPEKFRAERKKLGLDQGELGVLFGYSREQISRLESGATPIRKIHALAMWALIFGAPKQPKQ
jgi:transcriptional regulator with XRE-family HTH domain